MMAEGRQRPVVAIEACPEHRLPMTTIVETGPGISEPDQGLAPRDVYVLAVLGVGRGWRVEVAPGYWHPAPTREIAQVRAHAFSKKGG